MSKASKLAFSIFTSKIDPLDLKKCKASGQSALLTVIFNFLNLLSIKFIHPEGNDPFISDS